MFIYLFQTLLVSAAAMVHPFFISMTDINYNAKNKSVEVSVRIFADDFEKAIAKNCNCRVDVSKTLDKERNEKLMNDYILKHLQIKVEGQPVKLQFAGYQQEDGSIWSYFEVKNVNSFKSIELNNSILHDYNDSQVNMVHIKANGKEKSDKLDYPNNIYILKW